VLPFPGSSEEMGTAGWMAKEDVRQFVGSFLEEAIHF